MQAEMSSRRRQLFVHFSSYTQTTTRINKHNLQDGAAMELEELRLGPTRRNLDEERFKIYRLTDFFCS